MSLVSFLPLLSFVISITNAILIFTRYIKKGGTHLLIWAIGMVFYGVGGLSEALYGLFGWNPIVFRLWYLFGAILVAAWLGQGTVYLLVRTRIAHITMAVVLVGSIYAAVRVFTAQLDPSLMTSSLHTGSELSGHAIITPGVRSLTPIFNSYGTLTLVGGAIYSAFIFWRKRIMAHRALGNLLIAAGAIFPAFGGAFSRFGIPGALYISEVLGAILLLAGFMRAVTPMKDAK